MNQLGCWWSQSLNVIKAQHTRVMWKCKGCAFRQMVSERWQGKKKKKSVTAYPLNRIPRVTLLWHSSYCAVSPVMGKSNLSQPLETELKLWNSSLGNVPFLHCSIFECACALWTLLDLFYSKWQRFSLLTALTNKVYLQLSLHVFPTWDGRFLK